GHAKIISPWSVEIKSEAGIRKVTTRTIIIATGSAPLIPSIPGLSAADCLTSDTFWELTTLPRRLVVLGSGPVGCELAQAMARFGVAVTIVETTERILGREDPD